MKRFLLLLLQIFVITTMCGQTIIDLKLGGGVRAKTVDDYRKEIPGNAEKLRADSIKYNDNLTRAFNELYRDSINKAEILLREALQLRPNAPSNFIVHHYLGRIAFARGNYREAIASYSLLLKERPENKEIRFERASCYLEIKNTKAALEDCESLMSSSLSKQEQIKVLFLRSACHTEERHPEKAKTDLESILRLDVNNESAQLLLAFAFRDLGQTNEALNRLNLFVAGHPLSVNALLARADLEKELNMWDAARVDYDKAINIAPNNPQLYIKRAELLSTMNLPQQAQKDIETARRLLHTQPSLPQIENE